MSGDISRQGCVPVLFCTIADPATLAAHYMPYLKGGGIFIPGETGYALGDDIFIIVSLPDEPARLAVHAKVAWISPPKSGQGREPGIGIRFAGSDNRLRTKIERLLAKPEHRCDDGATSAR